MLPHTCAHTEAHDRPNTSSHRWVHNMFLLGDGRQVGGNVVTEGRGAPRAGAALALALLLALTLLLAARATAGGALLAFLALALTMLLVLALLLQEIGIPCAGASSNAHSTIGADRRMVLLVLALTLLLALELLLVWRSHWRYNCTGAAAG